ncbi:MAG: transcription antitermination factor NusB [Hyphomicrobiaceae bacterium]|nr:transcription antitermination factor NusB [Hyphomicrobiaceae bacterium]
MNATPTKDHAKASATPRSASRSAARLSAVQALYQMDMTGIDASDVVAEFEKHRLGDIAKSIGAPEADRALFEDIVLGVVREQQAIDPVLDAHLADGWRLARVDSILRAILRSAAFELALRDDIPAKAVINEYVDIAHAYFGPDEPKVVNGILDQLARSRRAHEFERKSDE